ncbi:zinc ribbon domain-containing protein [Sulfuricurvum sp.]|uniref:zinc ribbon domain-containing protein n=1 Tax=Sulfuricurvum sp. TaxID=2025608 RepID=UPI0026078FBE|nr:zinc ribbon domain-containing protein [Sulfuricurvum sp.]MDD2838804.1 zinc ribbon domain-containing protein [Sulfuricurvum sp.]MDD3595550.1 zinc ribbon domain-containing protein [Sulfuricurvum sp.]MDD4883034.1 zinc ribbon domain-containing protein [Sulfuricurvum sp.]
MNKHLEQLIELSLVDKEIDAFEPQIEEANLQYEALMATQNGIANEIAALKQEIKDEQIKKHKNELHLAELSAKLDDNSKKSAEVKTEREMKSLQLEEEIAKEQVSFANEEIERLEKLIDHKQSKIDELEAKSAEIEGTISTVKADVDVKLGRIDEERKEVFARKEALVGAMNQKGLSFYQKIRRWAKNTTAVPVRNQACMGCYMAISDKVYSDVIKGEEITMCPHCGRILYLEPSSDAIGA